MSVFVHSQGINTVHAGRGGGVKKWQNSVHVLLNDPLFNSAKLSMALISNLVEALSIPLTI